MKRMHKTQSIFEILLDELRSVFTRKVISNFFLSTGSHLKSIKMILDNKADVAAIDSNVLKFYFQQNPADQDNLSVVTSLGPMPIYPVVFNSRLSGKISHQHCPITSSCTILFSLVL